MHLVCTTCDADLGESPETWLCPLCGVDAVVAKICAACGVRNRLVARVCLQCEAAQPAPTKGAARAAIQARGNLLLREKRYYAAHGHFDEAVQLDPDAPGNWLGRVLALKGLNRPVAAARALRDALAHAPLDEQARAGLEAELVKTSAAAQLEALVTEGPPHERARAVLASGMQLLADGHCEDGVPFFEYLIELYPREVDGWLGKAYALRALGRDEEAWASVSRAFELAPRSEAVLRALAEWRPPAEGAAEPDEATTGHEDSLARASDLVRRIERANRPAPLEEKGRDAEQRYRERLGHRWHLIEKSLRHMGARSDAIDSARAAELEAARIAAPEMSAASPDASVGELLASADRLAEVGQLGPALEEVERALAVDLEAPGGAERWRRWGALVRESELAREALVGGAAADTDRIRGELREAARTLEATGSDAAAAVAWALSGEDRSRLRLLAQPHVCEALMERLVAACDAADPATGAGAVAARVRDGRRRLALAEARALLSTAEDPAVAEIAALVTALAVRGPCLDIWMGNERSEIPESADTPAARLLASDRVRLALGERMTLGRLGASICVTGPGVAPQHLAIWRDDAGIAVIADTGTAVGTTLAGARLGAPLPIGAGLRVELAGRVPVHVAPLDPGRGDSPIVVEVGEQNWLLPLGPLEIGARADLVRPCEPLWTLTTSAGDEPWVSARAPRGARPQLCGAPATDEIDLCFGDVVRSSPGDPPLLGVRPPDADRAL